MSPDSEVEVLRARVARLVEQGTLRPPRDSPGLETHLASLAGHGEVLVSFVRLWFALHDGSSDFLASHFRVLSSDDAFAVFDRLQHWPIHNATELELHNRRLFPLLKCEYRDTDIGVLWDETHTFRMDLPIILISGDSRLSEVLDCNLAGLLRYVDDRPGWEQAWAAIPHMLNPQLPSEQWDEF